MGTICYGIPLRKCTESRAQSRTAKLFVKGHIWLQIMQLQGMVNIFSAKAILVHYIIWISEFKIAAGSPALWPHVLATFHPQNRKCHAKIEVVSYQTIKQPKNVLKDFLEKWVDKGLEISSVLQKLKRRILVHREHATNSFTRLFMGETCKFALDKLLRHRLCVSASVIKI